ncbi:MAG: hypothetical protein LBB22_04645 [Treponema sp.]|jgi:hypothetical protein|nr:hypothetical protein [Treponema sp.]
MGRIKSALELALERTEQVKGDKSSLEQHDARQRGKKLANEYLEGEVPGLDTAIKNTPENIIAAFKQGLFETLLARISLPSDDKEAARLETLGKGLQTVVHDSRFPALWKRFQAMAMRYLDEAAQYEEAIKQQFAPKLRQKEAELSRRLGQEIRLDPFQDPEFLAFYKKNIDALKANYESIISEAREQISKFLY